MYGFQVHLEVIRDGKPVMEWRDVHPANGEPYRYATRGEAEGMARMCYGNDPSVVRVIEFAE